MLLLYLNAFIEKHVLSTLNFFGYSKLGTIVMFIIVDLKLIFYKLKLN
jgi:hypothetical protein